MKLWSGGGGLPAYSLTAESVFFPVFFLCHFYPSEIPWACEKMNLGYIFPVHLKTLTVCWLFRKVFSVIGLQNTPGHVKDKMEMMTETTMPQ